MATENDQVWPDVAIPPGETLAETLAARGMTQADLARRMGRPVQTVNEIVKGTKEITPETALQFERVLGTPAHVWVRLEADYRFNKARIADQQRLKDEVAAMRAFPYLEMAKHGWVPMVSAQTERARCLLEFFGVGSLATIPDTAAGAAWRRSAKVKYKREALAAWLRRGERLGARVKTAPFDEQLLRQFLRQCRSMSRVDPSEWEPLLKRQLASCGVAVVFLHHLAGTGAHGATRWMSSDRVLVQVSPRNKWADSFWFTLFHELGHVLLHHPRREVFINFDVDGDACESAANDFAGDALIDPAHYAEFVATRRVGFSESAVRQFALLEGVHPGIVVGRLHHDGLLPKTHMHGLRQQYGIAAEEDPLGQ
jgi:HTH-type transcriptional regulator/antitoxin HigA